MQLLLPFPETACPCILWLLSLCDRPGIEIQSTITVCGALFFCVQDDSTLKIFGQNNEHLNIFSSYATTMPLLCTYIDVATISSLNSRLISHFPVILHLVLQYSTLGVLLFHRAQLGNTESLNLSL